jgi:PAS domain S-box-containing protein
MAMSRSISVRRIHAILQQAAEPIFVLDAAHCLAFVNEAWEQLTGFTHEAVAGLPCRGPLPIAEPGPATLAACLSLPAEALAGNVCSASSLIVCASGERIWRSIEFWPMWGREGRYLGAFAAIRPLSKPKAESDPPSHRLHTQLLELRERFREIRGKALLVGAGAAQERLLVQIENAAKTRNPVTLVGEPGTGKQLVARAIQEQGSNSSAPLLRYDVEAIPADELVITMLKNDSEASEVRTWAAPNGATLIIGDLAALPRDLQSAMRAMLAAPGLEGHNRLIFTSLKQPKALWLDDRLQGDFYHAITSLVIELPPLRERLEELPLLAQHFLELQNAKGERIVSGFSATALDVLRAYDWPGNLSELARVIAVAHEQCSSGLISAADIPVSIRGQLAAAHNPPAMPPPVTPLDATLEQAERRLIERALAWSRHNKSRAADLLAISRPRLYRRMKDLEIPDLPEGS